MNTSVASDTAEIKFFLLDGLRKFFVCGEFFVMEGLSGKACILWCGFLIIISKFYIVHYIFFS